MNICKRSLFTLTCCLLLILPLLPGQVLAACAPPARIVGDTYTPTSIQNAYDYASGTLNLPDFTLQLSEGLYTEKLLLDRGAVLLDGGYDCSFTTKISTTDIFGSVTLSGGAANFAGVKIVSTDQCAFDVDGDGFFCGPCVTGPVDCSCNDPNINPGALEICDGIDNNCDGQIDEGAIPIDADGDGYYAIGSCGNSPYTDDCNDADVTINPGALDVPYDGIDQDCNGADLRFDGETCFSCHVGITGPPETWAGLHVLTAATDPSCAGCHAPIVSSILSGHYGRTVVTDGNGMTAGSVIVCTSCHDASVSNHYNKLGTGSELVWGKVLLARPNVTCDSCHADRAAAHETAAAHDNRVIDASCSPCHTSDAAVLGSPGNGTLVSAADVDSLHGSVCARCHSYTGTLLNAAIVREVIKQGVSGIPVSCLDCHSGHGDHSVAVGANDLSYDAPGQLCSNCHVVASWAEIEGVEHNVPTNGAGSCATCHNSARQEVIATIAEGAAPTNCIACHANKYLTVHGSIDHEAAGYVTRAASCVACHDAETVLGVIEIHNNNCSLCHAPVPTLLPSVPPGGGDCVSCHISAPDPDATWESIHTLNTPNHNSLVQVATTGCGNCHSDPPPLVDETNPKNHDFCSSCHDVNGGLISLAFGQTFVPDGDCTSCHIGTWRALHPGEPDHSDIVTVGTTSCGNCHDDTLVSGAATTHTGCSTCHNLSTGALISLATGKTAPGDCTSCHSNDWSASHTTACLSCHDQAQDNLDGLPAGGRRAVAGEFPAGTNHAHFANSAVLTNGDCQTCHDLTDHTNGSVKLLDADTGNRYVFQRVADLTTDPDLSTFCMSCHDQDGASRLTEPMNPFGNGNSPNNTASRFQGTLEWTEYYGDICFGWEGSLRFVNSHHDISDADQTNSGSKVECLNCHSAHAAADTQTLVDPYNALTPWTNGINNFCQTCHNGGEDVYNVTLPEGVAMGKIEADIDGDNITEQVNALGGMDSCSYSRNPWWVDVKVTDTAHMQGSKRAWGGYSGAPAYVMECTACHDPHGSYSLNNPAGNPYAIRDVVDGTAYVDDGARTLGFNGPPWTTFGVSQEVILTPTVTPGSENLDLRNLCSKCHADWEAAYSWHGTDCTACLSCHSHGAAWDSQDFEYGGNTPWCP